MVKVCFCGSQRFRREMCEFIAAFKTKTVGRGVVCFHPEFKERRPGFECSPEKERMLDVGYRQEVPGLVYNHLFRKVLPADVVFIFNQDGYIGMNTIGEIFGAAACGKVIVALDQRFLTGTSMDDLYEEPSVQPFVHMYAATPQALCACIFNEEDQ